MRGPASLHRLALGFVPLALSVALVGTSAAAIVVKPGKLDKFVITVLGRPVAGERVPVRIEAFDARGNLVTEHAGEGFRITVSGAARVAPAAIKAREFSGGVTVTVSDEKAEEIQLAVFEEGGAVPIGAARFTVRPNKIDRFEVVAPSRVTAGDTLQVRLVARDAFGNLIDDFTEGSGVRFEFAGRGSVRPRTEAGPIFRGGEAVAEFVAEKAGDLRIGVRDTASAGVGQGPPLEIVPAKTDRFTVVAPRAAVAGDPFTVTVTAFDRFDNPVTAYAQEGETVVFLSSTGGQFKPGSAEARLFDKGRLLHKVTYEKAETFRIVVEGKNKGPRGESEPVTVVPADPDHFVLTTPGTAVAGEPFTVVLEAQDRFNNTIPDYHLIGGEVFLATDGTGELVPATVPPSAFRAGKAEVLLTYDKAESFNLRASLKGVVRKRQEAPEVSEEERARQRADQARREAEARLEAQREEERAAALKAKEDALKARQAAEETGRMAPVPPPSEDLPPVPPAATGPARPDATVVKPASLPPAEVKPAPAAARDLSRQRLEGISILEAGSQAILVLSLSGPVNYDVTMSTSAERQWIFVELAPAVRDAGRVAAQLTAQSSLVGQVKTSDKGGDRLEVAIEVLPKNISYTVEQDGASVVVKVNKAE